MSSLLPYHLDEKKTNLLLLEDDLDVAAVRFSSGILLLSYD